MIRSEPAETAGFLLYKPLVVCYTGDNNEFIIK